MKRILLMLVFIFLFIPISVRASENYAPPVPDSAIKYMPENTESFSEGLWDILQNAIQKIYPTIYDADQYQCRSFKKIIHQKWNSVFTKSKRSAIS